MTPRPVLGSLARLTRGLAALVAVVLLLVGPPVLLWRYIGWPLPDHVPTWEDLEIWLTSPLTDQILINTLACLVWVLWASLALSLVSEAVAAARGIRIPRLPAVAPLQAFAAALIGAIAFSLPTIRTTAHDTAIDATLAAHATDSAAVAPTHPGQDRPSAAEQPQPRSSRPPARDDAPDVRTVERGDTLWGIAEDEYGRGSRYWRIYHATEDRPQPQGLPQISDPDVIYPGQHVYVPDHDTDDQPPPNHGDAQDPQQPQGSPSPSPHATATPSVPDTPTPEPPTPSPTPPQASPTTHTPPAPGAEEPPDDPAEDHGPPAVLDLPSGALVGLSFAAAVGAAITFARLHRRRRRIPMSVPGEAEREPPLGGTLRRLRRAYLAWLATLRRDSGDGNGSAEPERPAGSRMRQPVLEPPGCLVLGERGGEELRIDLGRAGGVGVEGPGAVDVARAVLAGLLVGNQHGDVEVVIPRADAAELLAVPEADVADVRVPGLVVRADLDDALMYVEVEMVHRARLMETYQARDITGLRRDHPDEPISTLVLLAAPHPAAVGRLRSVLNLGRTYDITGVVRGAWTHGTTCHVEADGTVTDTAGAGEADLAGARLFHLPIDDLSEIVDLVRAAHGEATPREAGPPATGPAGHADAEAAPTPTEPGPSAEESPSVDGAEPTRADAEQPEPATPEPAPPAYVRVLGPPRIEVRGEEITTGLRRDARTLLTYLALHPDGVRRDVAFDALWPDLDPNRDAERFRTAVRNARQVLRTATGAGSAMFITHAAGRYRLDPNVIDTDLRRFDAALEHAADTSDPATRVHALRHATTCYTGPLLDGVDHLWVEAPREHTRRRVVDALIQLAEATRAHDPERALADLNRALDIDGYNEQLYRRVMTTQAQLGHTDAAQRTYRLLETRLNELDTEPDETTATLLDNLLRPTSHR